MTKLLSATDVAIALAIKSNSLRLTERPSRLGGTFIAISDEHGLIEVADDMGAALDRIDDITRRAA